MYIFPNIVSHKSIKSIQTTRLNGFSSSPYDSCNMGVFSPDSRVEENIQSIENTPHKPFFLQQVHSNKVVEYKHVLSRHGELTADACFTHKKNIICSVLTADCLPVLIADEDATVVAAVHCGWRGLYSNILAQTIKKLAVDVAKLHCWLGPCISYKPYRVNAEFRQQFVNKHNDFSHCFYLDKKNIWHADLKKIALMQLQNLGVKFITQSPYCTYENKQLFYSYRRDGETGRMASMIWISS